MDIEELATNAVTDAVSIIDNLVPHISRKDKEPSFDGYIYIYENNSKKNLKRVPVQIKGKKVKTAFPAGIKHSISITDLNNYMRNGGVMFFVVYINEKQGLSRQIYYSSLPPFKIKLLLRNKNNRSTINVSLRKIPILKEEVIELFLNFYSDSKMQTSYAEREIPTVKDLARSGNLESLMFSYTSMQGNNSVISYPKKFNGKELCIYANTKGSVAPIPVDYIPEIKNMQLSCTENMPVSVNDTVYYSTCRKIITEDKIEFKIGSSVSLVFPNGIISAAERKSINFNINVGLKGTLKERIQSLEFLISMLNSKSFNMGNVRIPANFPNVELEKLNASNYPELLSEYKRARSVLEKLNVKKDLNIDDFSEEDFWKLDSLIGAIENNTPVKNAKEDLPIKVSLDFGGLHLALICKKQRDGAYFLSDYFGEYENTFVILDSNQIHPVSQYSVMTAEDFLTYDNLNIQRIVNDFKRIETNPCNVNNGNLVMLEMLKAYDKEKKEELLNASKQMYEWIETVNQNIPEEIMILNNLQITLRERELSFGEKQKLYKIVTYSDSSKNKIGALLLLGEQSEVDSLLADIPKEERELFKSYPIFNFYKGHRED